MASQEKSLLIDSLVGGIAHELNNKLSPIIGFSTFFARESDIEASEAQSTFRMIEECASEAAQIIRQLLELSRPPAAEMIPCNIDELVVDVSKLLGFEAREANCKIEVERQSNSAMIDADLAQLKQVLINLAINGIHASAGQSDASIFLKTSRTTDHALISVVDQGCGISEENLSKIFEPFFSTKGQNKGNGLGLNVCKGITALHKGNIQVNSSVDEGAEFIIELPLSKSLKLDSKADPQSSKNNLQLEENSLSKAYILVVDDEPYLTLLIQKGLRNKFGVETISASDGYSAQEKIRGGQFDIIVSDVRMPKMDGFELFDWITNHHPDLSDRFLFMTGDPGGKVFNDRLSDLPVPVLRKPFDIGSLSQHCIELIASKDVSRNLIS